MNNFNSNESVKIVETAVSKNVIQAFKAIDDFDAVKLQKLFEEGLVPNCVNSKGVPLLHYAINVMAPSLVEIILQNGADPNIRKNVKENSSLTSFINLSIKKDIKIEGATPLISVLNVAIPKEFEKILGNSREEIVDMLIYAGAKVNMREESVGLAPLHFAAHTNNETLIKKLIENGADINVKAFRKEYHDFENPNDVVLTPLIISVFSDKNPEKTSNCVNFLIKSGAGVDDNAHIPWVYMSILLELSQSNIDKTREILLRRINLDFSKMDTDRVHRTVDTFINSESENNSYYEHCARNLLDKNVRFNNKIDQLTYLGHLNSWEGEISSNLVSKRDGEPPNLHYTKDVEGWTIGKQIPLKITNLLYILKGLQKPEIDCVSMFGESREKVIAKVKDEISSQVSTFFTGRLIQYSSSLKWLLSEKIKNEISNSSQEWVNEDLNKTYDRALLGKMAEIIGNLKIGKNFSLYFGVKGHATFADYVKQFDGKITRKNYNLGAGLEEHPVSLDNKIYPHSIVNIHAEPFINKDNSALAHLYSFIVSNNNPPYDSDGKVHPAFKDAYNSALKLGGEMPQSVDGLIPMKYQVVGNCSVKNNNFALRNRLQNDRLYKFIKNYEIMVLKQQLNVDNKLVYSKELQKDIQNLSIIVAQKKYPQLTEKELYRFFAKRTEIIPEIISKVPGDRLAYAIEKATNSNLNEEYFAASPKIFDAIEKIADYYKSDKLKSVLKKYSEAYEVQSEASMNTMIRKNLFDEFARIPTEGRTNVASSKDEAVPMDIDVKTPNHIAKKRITELSDFKASMNPKSKIKAIDREI